MFNSKSSAVSIPSSTPAAFSLREYCVQIY